MSASDFPQTAVGLPASFKYDLPPSISDECTSYSVNVGAETDSITGGSVSAPVFVANSSGGPFPFRQEQVIFNIPSGNSDSVFLDPVATTVSFRMSFRLTTASAGGAAVVMSLIGSGASWFDRLELYSNNKQIETVDNYNLLQNYLLANTVSASERFGGISTCMGADSNTANGMDIPVTTANTTFYVAFTIPLLSIIGVNSDKYFPVGIAKNLQLRMITSRHIPFVNYCTTIPTTQPVFSAITLDKFQLNMRYVDVGRQAAQQLRMTMQAGKWLYKSTTYKSGVAQIPNGAIGSLDLEIPIRCASLRSLLHQFSTPTSTNCLNGFFDAICPALIKRQLLIGQKKYPTREINDLQNPSDAYMYLIQALGGAIPKSLGTIVFRDIYLNVFPSLPTNYPVDITANVPSSGLRTTYTGSDAGASNYLRIINYPNASYYGYDTERVNSTLFSGTSTKQEPPVISLNIASQMTRVVTCFAWGMADIVLEFDSVTKDVTAFV